MTDTMKDHFRGALLGTFLGDATGGPLEGVMHERARDIHSRVHSDLQEQSQSPSPPTFDDVAGPIADTLLDQSDGRYSDDTQLTIALAEALLDTPGDIDLTTVALRFGQNYDPERGYGPHAAGILEEIKQGVPWQEAVEKYKLPGGSYGNGAAMRVAPIALAFFPDEEKTAAAAESQAVITGHSHAVARFGSRIMALAILCALSSKHAGSPFDPVDFLENQLAAAPAGFISPLKWVMQNIGADPWAAVEELGAGISASQSVPFALWCFFSSMNDPVKAIARAATVGGDSDTVAAMTGAIAGAYCGAEAFGTERLSYLENDSAGKDYLIALADKLYYRCISQSEE